MSSKRKRSKGKRQLRVVDRDFKPKTGTGNFSNGLVPPVLLTTKRERELWYGNICTAPWLEQTDAFMAHQWMMLWIRYEQDPYKASANMFGKLSQLGSKLGFSPASRKRLGLLAKRPRLRTVLKLTDVSKKYFADNEPEGAA